jgi:integral membrane protein
VSNDNTPTAPRKRRFAGTPAQIRSAATFYKVLAYATGIMLLLLCAEMIAKYGFHFEAHLGSLNLSTTVLIVHGWMYVVYLIADFNLWSKMRWPFSRFITIALGGVVPLLSFFMENKVHREVERELREHPEAAKRY